MPSEITSEERAAINAAVASGSVQKVPDGKSGHSGYLWNPLTLSLELRNSEDSALRSFSFGRKPDPKVAARRRDCLKRHGEGVSLADLAREHGVSIFTIKADIQKLGGKSSRKVGV